MPHSIGVQVVAEGLTARETECLERAISAINGLQSQFLVRDAIRKITLPGKRSLLKEDASFDALLRRAKKDRLFCVTSRSFAGNEFQLADERCSLLTIDDWEDKYAPPSLHTYIVYQFAFAFLTWAADNVSDNILTHKKTIGCRMDYCRNKRELKLGCWRHIFARSARAISGSSTSCRRKSTPSSASLAMSRRLRKAKTA
jgi:hypothetical protein